MFYKDWLDDWLKNYVAPSVKARTLHSYSEIISKRLKPTWGEYDVSDITPLMVQKYVTELLQTGNLKNGSGLAPNTVNSIITVLQGSFQMAYALGIIPEYNMQKIKRPKVKEKKTECFTIAEQKIIERAVWGDKRDKMKGIVLCLYTGLRIGELTCQWKVLLTDICKATKRTPVCVFLHTGVLFMIYTLKFISIYPCFLFSFVLQVLFGI